MRWRARKWLTQKQRRLPEANKSLECNRKKTKATRFSFRKLSKVVYKSSLTQGCPSSYSVRVQHLATPNGKAGMQYTRHDNSTNKQQNGDSKRGKETCPYINRSTHTPSIQKTQMDPHVPDARAREQQPKLQGPFDGERRTNTENTPKKKG